MPTRALFCSSARILEAGHYFNPHAQRIIEGKERGAKICVIDTRLSNTASKADYWISSWPGSEGAILLAMCNIILQEDLFDRQFVRQWVNWEDYLREEHPDKAQTFQTFIARSERDSTLNTRRNSPPKKPASILK